MRLYHLYYRIKPLLPRTVQILGRRARAAWKRAIHKNTWPIDPATVRIPEGWPGWPERKRFALVLSHDIDTARGHGRCLRLMNAEMQLGFRSSFNFVAEDYPVDPELRETLRANGFAIGLHGLHHNGELFQSRENFERAAPRLGRYLKDWGSAGFHAPSMLSNLEWITELDIEYDCSTFDTDPFEPQPNGVGSIFPLLLVSEPQKRGFVELPYTLPQDHCLFIILREKTIDIWKRKLDWIASLGGMAFLNTHPDYMNFDERPCDFEEYPADHYLEFLRYLKTRYAGQYWQTDPRGISRYCQEIAPSLRIIPVQGKGSAPSR